MAREYFRNFLWVKSSRASTRATNNPERDCAFPGRLTGVPGKRCFVNAVETLYASVPGRGGSEGVAESSTVVEKFESEWPRDIALFCCSRLSGWIGFRTGGPPFHRDHSFARFIYRSFTLEYKNASNNYCSKTLLFEARLLQFPWAVSRYIQTEPALIFVSAVRHVMLWIVNERRVIHFLRRFAFSIEQAGVYALNLRFLLIIPWTFHRTNVYFLYKI